MTRAVVAESENPGDKITPGFRRIGTPNDDQDGLRGSDMMRSHGAIKLPKSGFVVISHEKILVSPSKR